MNRLVRLIRFALNHPMIGGGLAVTAVGTAVGFLRAGIGKVFEYVRNRVLLTVTITSEDRAYGALHKWFAEQPQGKRSRNLDLTSELADDGRGGKGPGRTVKLGPGVGDHVYRHGRMWLWLTVTREKARANRYSSGGDGHVDTMIMRVARGGRAEVQQLVEEALEAIEEQREDMVEIHENNRGDWHEIASRRRRRIETLIFPGRFLAELVADVRAFDEEREWYAGLGIPHRRGYLLTGPPGNGKSSLAFALAGETGRNVYLLNLSESGMSDGDLRGLLAETPTDALMLIEDIDAIAAGRGVQTTNPLTYSGLLNALDGVASSEGRVLIMTTNHPEVLDEALVRPGRIDMTFEVGDATAEQAEALFLRFFPADPWAPQLAGRFAAWAGRGTMSMAALQEHLVRHRRDMRRAADPAEPTRAAA